MRCGPTKKVAFKTHELALIRGGEILTQETNRRHTPKAFRAYHCKYCGQYHLTEDKSLDSYQYDGMMVA